jgi:methylenetetrahydrofolate dehydrogenase (NADP+)/methenyltetrahydrofolate cyclohydrolase
MQIISGTERAREIRARVREENHRYGVVPHLAMIVVGDFPENLKYVGMKEKAAVEVGGSARLIHLSGETRREELLKVIAGLNQDAGTDGILLQLPLPVHLENTRDDFLQAIELEKDVDGFNPVNRGRLSDGPPLFVSCVALGSLGVVEQVFPNLKGKRACLVGDSFDLVLPLATMLIARGCRVTVAGDYQPAEAGKADILVVEKGYPNMVKGSELENQEMLLIDAGFYWQDGRSCGNVDRESVEGCPGFLVPSPGGLGPLTIATLMENLSRAARRDGR